MMNTDELLMKTFLRHTFLPLLEFDLNDGAGEVAAQSNGLGYGNTFSAGHEME